MFNQILRFTLVSSVLLWLKPRWRGLLALIVAVGLVHVIHGEYLGYVELSGNQSFLVWSYALKWFSLVVCIGLYFYCMFGRRGQLLNRDMAGERGTQKAQNPSNESGQNALADDGFNFIREKERLENRAEKILNKET